MKQLTDEEWRAKLTPEQFRVLRQQDTEPAFSGRLLHNDKTGDYSCAACGQVVFDSNTKFDSGSGWPSFYDVADTKAVKLVDDTSHGLRRVEVRCSRCASHLGHVFNDAPDKPTGVRFCINSAALDFKPKGKAG